MPKFEDDFRGPFDSFSHDNINSKVPYEGRKRGNENSPLDVMAMNEMSLSVSQSTTGTKKAKTISETNKEKGVTSLTEGTSVPLKNNSGTTQLNASEGRSKERMLMEANSNSTRIEAALQNEGKEAQLLLLKWKPPFTESEAFEAFFPSGMDQLLKDALQVEAHLKNQKEQLRSRLTHLSQTLKIHMK